MNITIKILKDIGLLTLFLSIITGLGYALNSLIDSYNLFGWLTELFSLMKYFSSSIDFMWNTAVMWQVIGYILAIEILWWGYLASVAIIKWFK